MAKSRWYVIQVPSGRERTLAQAIRRVAAEEQTAQSVELAAQGADTEQKQVLEECFSPRFQTQKKVHGEWENVEELLFPGYLIAVTAYPDALKLALRRVPEFTRLLAVGETFVPLSESDQDLINTFTREGRRCVPMSFGVADGDRVLVTSGPLTGKEALIKSVNRRKSLAYLEFQICGRTVTTKVGLGILTKKDTPPAT